jgi:hypothetical protein
MSTDMWTMASTYHFEEKNYTVTTTDNSHGKMDKGITEIGEFDVHGKTLTLRPKTRLVCPKLVHEWQDKGQVIYTNELKTDSIYFNGIQRCSDFSEYISINKESLSIENSNLLGFSTKTYIITIKNGHTSLSNIENPDDVLVGSKKAFKYIR